MLSLFSPRIFIPYGDKQKQLSIIWEIYKSIGHVYVNFPVKIDSTITKFEKANRLIVNIYSEEDNTVVPVRISPTIDDVYTPFLNDTKDISITKDNIQEYTKQLLDLNTNTRLVNLFLFNEHYSLINNLHRLVSNQISASDCNHNYICYRCLSSCKSPLKYYYHLRFCVKNKATKAVTNLPKPGTFLSFNQQKAQQKLPFAVYYDFECYFKEFSTTRTSSSFIQHSIR